jgi:tRNA (cytidine/uridine-2'-O-)-methyltransferase
MNIVLHEPQIPYNTGNIGRTCVTTGTRLHLIKPLGFDTSDKAIKRAGLDYWREINVTYYSNFDEFIEINRDCNIYMCTTKAKKTYSEVKYNNDDFIMFGNETSGIPEEILINYPDNSIRIPMLEKHRSLNLSNAAAIILYEALRQNEFIGMQLKGELHRNNWDMD